MICTWCRQPGATFPSFVVIRTADGRWRRRRRVILHVGCGEQLRDWAVFKAGKRFSMEAT